MPPTPRLAPPSADSVFTVMIRRSLPPSAVAGLLACLVLGVVGGLGAGISGLVGVLVALAFFASGLLVMARFVTDGNPMLFMAVGMSVYFAQVIALLGVLVLARSIEALDLRAAGIAMLVSVLVWQVAQVVAWRRARIPVYDEPTTTDQTREDAS